MKQADTPGDVSATAEHDTAAVLLVEDNPDHEELIRRALQERAVRVDLRVARHGEEAVDYLLRRGGWTDARLSPRPRLVLMDLRLPRLDGFQVLELVKGSPDLCGIPVVVLTTSESELDVSRACACRANSYLVKPADFAELTDLLDSVARYWLRLNRQPATAGPA
jgi:CheY-like chemotaxis protein